MQFTYLARAIEIYELLLGYDHPETADAYSKIGIAYQEAGRFEAACPWMRRAFVVFFKSFGSHDDITQATYRQLMSLEVILDTGLEKVPYEDLPKLIFDLE